MAPSVYTTHGLWYWLLLGGGVAGEVRRAADGRDAVAWKACADERPPPATPAPTRPSEEAVSQPVIGHGLSPLPSDPATP